MPNTNNNTPLTDTVKDIKLIARDSLRMNLISPRLSKISEFEIKIQESDTQIEKYAHKIDVLEYEISKLDTEHPDYQKTKENKEEIIKEFTKEITSTKEYIEEQTKQITNQIEKITNIESGETKVSKDALASLVDTLIIEHTKKQIQ